MRFFLKSIETNLRKSNNKVRSCRDGMIKLLDADTGAELMTLTKNARRIVSTAISPDGRRIVMGDIDGMVKLWDTATGAELMTLREHGREDSLDRPRVEFSPDGKTIAIGGSGITLLESEVPADGYQAWRNGIAARKVVDALHEEHGFYAKVIERLKSDGPLEDPVRKVALQIANARLWEDAEKQKQKTSSE